MTNNVAKRRGFNWRPYLYAILAACVIFTPLALNSDVDVFYFFLIAPALLIMGFCVLAYAAIRRNLQIAVALGIFWAVSAVLMIYSPEIRSPLKWLLWSSEYKKRVLAQPARANGDFQHTQWDGWGWAGIDTTIYLVYDPSDSLAFAAKSHQPGKFNGIPCVVPRVRRMQKQWYTITFYTEQDWNGCRSETETFSPPELPR